MTGHYQTGCETYPGSGPPLVRAALCSSIIPGPRGSGARPQAGSDDVGHEARTRALVDTGPSPSGGGLSGGPTRTAIRAADFRTGHSRAQPPREHPRPAGRGRDALRQVTVLGGYTAAGVAVTWPLATYLRGRLPDLHDPASYVWSLWWVAHQVTHLGNPWFTARLAAPAGVALGYDTLMPLLGLLMLPVTLVAGPAVSYNVLVVLLPGVLCYALYRVARMWLTSQASAVAARRPVRPVHDGGLPGLDSPEHRGRDSVPAAGPRGGGPAAAPARPSPGPAARVGDRPRRAGEPGVRDHGRVAGPARSHPLAGRPAVARPAAGRRDRGAGRAGAGEPADRRDGVAGQRGGYRRARLDAAGLVPAARRGPAHPVLPVAAAPLLGARIAGLAVSTSRCPRGCPRSGSR